LDEVLQSGPAVGFTLLEKLFTSFIRFGMENKRSFELMFLIQDPELEKYATPAKMGSYEKFAGAVSKGIQGCSAEKRNRVDLVWTLFLALHGFVAFYIHSDRNYEDIVRLADTHVHLLLYGLK
jgi:hypothetical protein